MSWPEYPKYRESGIQWLGEIPMHWSQRRGKYLFERMQRPAGPEDEIVTAFRDGEVTLRRHRREEGFTVALKESGYQGVRRGDLVIHAMDAFAGAIGVSAADGKCSPVYSCCRPHNGVSARLYAYLLRAMAEMGFIESLAKGIRERSTDFRWADFGELRLPVPPTGEQEAITWFLDHETARIDALIEEQKRLIDLLQEKRQAVISHAVTKGLNPDVPMKDSGVEWLGSVPEHWAVLPLKHGIDFREGPGILAEDFEESGVPLIRISNLKPSGVDLTGCNWLDPEKVDKRWGQFRVREGDLLISGSASTELISEVDKASDGSIPYTGIIIIRPVKGRTSKEFVRYLLQSRAFYAQIELEKTGSTIQHFGPTHLKRMTIALPPVGEQVEIAEQLSGELHQLSELLNEAARVIELLREHRSSLVSAAVTGKIDVRGLKPQNTPVEHELPRAAEPEAPYG